MTEFLLILVLTSAIAGVFLTSPNFKIKVFDRYVVKGMTYGVMAFCLMIVFAILAGLKGVTL